MKVSEINAAILSVQSMDELKLINEALSYQWKRVQKAQTKAFRVNQRVEWDSKNGRVMSGVIEKINQKTVSVNTGVGKWRVSAGLLRPARKEAA
jgi:hypothetical protein